MIAFSPGCAKKQPLPKPAPKPAVRQFNRIVSLAPGITEKIFYLGEQRRLVGVTSHCNYPPYAKKLTKVGGFGEPSDEKIVSLKPDLVLTSDYKAHPSFPKMQSLGLNVQDFETENFEDAIELVQRVGDAIGVPEKARAKTAALKARVEKIRKKYAGVKDRKRVYVELWYSPVTTAGKGSFVSDMIEIAGAKNVFDDVGKPYPQVSGESVVERDPQIIIIGYMLEKENKEAYIKNRPGWESVSAVRGGHVYSDIDPDLFLRPGPRLVDGLEAFEKKFHGGGKTE